MKNRLFKSLIGFAMMGGLILPSMVFAYTSADVDVPMYTHSLGHGATSYSSGWSEGIHLRPDKSDYCVDSLTIDYRLSGTNYQFFYTGGFLMYAANGTLLEISTSTLVNQTVYQQDGPHTWKFTLAEGDPVYKAYCTSQSQFIAQTGVLFPGDPLATIYYGWDTPTNACRTGNLSYTQCRQAGAVVRDWMYGFYGSKNGGAVQFASRNYDLTAVAFTSFIGANESFFWHSVNVESPEGKIGITTQSLGYWMMSQMLLILGSAFGFLGLLLPYIIALTLIGGIIYFIYRGFKFFRH